MASESDPILAKEAKGPETPNNTRSLVIVGAIIFAAFVGLALNGASKTTEGTSAPETSKLVRLKSDEATGRSCSEKYAQCGGNGFSGFQSCCGTSFDCFDKDDTFSQCRRGCPKNDGWGCDVSVTSSTHEKSKSGEHHKEHHRNHDKDDTSTSGPTPVPTHRHHHKHQNNDAHHHHHKHQNHHDRDRSSTLAPSSSPSTFHTEDPTQSHLTRSPSYSAVPTVEKPPNPSSEPSVSFSPTVYVDTPYPTQSRLTRSPSYSAIPTVEKPEDPTSEPTGEPSLSPTAEPSSEPTGTPKPSAMPTSPPSMEPSVSPESSPTEHPTNQPIDAPSDIPIPHPTAKPTYQPTAKPTYQPTAKPTYQPTAKVGA